jgi:hypothetical protein
MSVLAQCKAWLRRHPRLVELFGGYSLVMCIRPLVLLVARRLPPPPVNSVLHISYMVHVPWHMTRILRGYGARADYLALGGSPVWDRADFRYDAPRLPFLRALRELALFLSLLSRYRAVHLHFGLTPSAGGWEADALRRLGVRVIVHLRGCEARDRTLNMRLHPDVNICQDCDYNAEACSFPGMKSRIRRVMAAAHSVLVTTPDMLDFAPGAVHFPFFAPPGKTFPPRRVPPECAPFTLVHVTNHPGIEGTASIDACVERLRAKGYDIKFLFLRGVSHAAALEAIAGAHMAIGKMKMGYYANAQIESMMLGVPTITWVRPDLMTEELCKSAFIFSGLDTLETTLEYWLTHPEELAALGTRTRASILALHDEKTLARRLLTEYYNFSL